MELYVSEGGEHGQGDHPGRVFLCRPGVDDNVAECFETGGYAGHPRITPREAGERIARAVNVVKRIVEILDNEPEWDSDTMSAVANELAEAGYHIRDTEEQNADDEAGKEHDPNTCAKCRGSWASGN
jgi:hypothetical protein